MDWKKIIGTVAPTIASAVGGPLGGLAVSTISKAIGLPEGTSEEKVEEIIKKSNPEMLMKLKNAELKFKAQLKELEVDLAKVEADDRHSARQRALTMRDRTTPILALSVTLGFFGLLLSLIWVDVQNQTLLNVMVGALGTAWIAIISYYFGSSSSSAQKNQMLADKTPV